LGCFAGLQENLEGSAQQFSAAYFTGSDKHNQQCEIAHASVEFKQAKIMPLVARRHYKDSVLRLFDEADVPKARKGAINPSPPDTNMGRVCA
jgi:hypothetical protein